VISTSKGSSATFCSLLFLKTQGVQKARNLLRERNRDLSLLMKIWAEERNVSEIIGIKKEI
jgi:hypothetical protein